MTGPNTKEANVWVDKVEGEGTVDMHIDRLLLLLGNYDMTAECTNDSVTHSYDRRIKAYALRRPSGRSPRDFGGLVSLDGRWSID